MSEELISRGLYIDGEWQSPGGLDSIESANPADNSEVIGSVPQASEAELDAAVEASVQAQDDWAAMSSHDRGSFLRGAADDLEAEFEDVVELIVREMGKTRSAATGEVQRAIDLLNYYAEIGRDEGGIITPSASEHTTAYTQLEPLGTAGIITPWNYPIAIPTWKITPALISGNTVVLKPATPTPIGAARLVEAFEAAGLPDGVLNFVPGSGSTVGQGIVEHDDVDVISFTGSYDIGHGVHMDAADRGKRVQCEMGGKNPLIVDESANIDLAVQLTIDGGISGLAGQACTATSRVLVFESVYDEFLGRLTTAVEDLTVGDPLDTDTDVGPKVTAGELKSDLEYIQIGKDSDARLLTGGEALSGPVYDDGEFVAPTVFADVNPTDTIAQEEIFGPVISVIPVDNFSEAVSVANNVEYGLSASLCTNRLDHTKAFARESETGVVKINQTTTGVELQMPFGGRKHSSSETFKEQGRQALDFYTHEKAVYVTHVEE